MKPLYIVGTQRNVGKTIAASMGLVAEYVDVEAILDALAE